MQMDPRRDRARHAWLLRVRLLRVTTMHTATAMNAISVPALATQRWCSAAAPNAPAISPNSITLVMGVINTGVPKRGWNTRFEPLRQQRRRAITEEDARLARYVERRDHRRRRESQPQTQSRASLAAPRFKAARDRREAAQPLAGEIQGSSMTAERGGGDDHVPAAMHDDHRADDADLPDRAADARPPRPPSTRRRSHKERGE
mgnify:CR=1 FL=1